MTLRFVRASTYHLKSIDYTGTFEMLYEDVSLESIDRPEDNSVSPS